MGLPSYTDGPAFTAGDGDSGHSYTPAADAHAVGNALQADTGAPSSAVATVATNATVHCPHCCVAADAVRAGQAREALARRAAKMKRACACAGAHRGGWQRSRWLVIAELVILVSKLGAVRPGITTMPALLGSRWRCCLAAPLVPGADS